MPVTQSIEVLAGGSYALRAPAYIDTRVLAASTAEQHTVPANARIVVFSANGDFYAKYGSNPTAAVPAADVTDGSGSELNPTVRLVEAGSKISLIAPAATVVTLSFFR